MSLYRKYRPASFSEVVGQEQVTRPLSAALDAGRINHAYLFSGPRGCGKTSSARILARSLNCVHGPTSTPCGECESCRSLAPGGPGNLDVTELDAASHNGVDDMRELRDRAYYAPAESRYRVFIVDEAHMISNAGANALLKIVEEPPEHLIFIFATTEPEKVIGTIRSRTHHYPFRLLTPQAMRGLLKRTVEREGVAVDDEVYPLVIRAGGGSPRDSLSILDQLLAGAGEDGLSYDEALPLLGVTDLSLLDRTVDALAGRDKAALFETVDDVIESGIEPRRFVGDLLDRLRDLMILQAVPEAIDMGLVDAPADRAEVLREEAARFTGAQAAALADQVNSRIADMRGATSPRLLLEVLLAHLALLVEGAGPAPEIQSPDAPQGAGAAPAAEGEQAPSGRYERPSKRAARQAREAKERARCAARGETQPAEQEQQPQGQGERQAGEQRPEAQPPAEDARPASGSAEPASEATGEEPRPGEARVDAPHEAAADPAGDNAAGERPAGRPQRAEDQAASAEASGNAVDEYAADEPAPEAPRADVAEARRESAPEDSSGGASDAAPEPTARTSEGEDRRAEAPSPEPDEPEDEDPEEEAAAGSDAAAAASAARPAEAPSGEDAEQRRDEGPAEAADSTEPAEDEPADEAGRQEGPSDEELAASIRENWGELREAIRKKNGVAGVMVTEARVLDVRDGTVLLGHNTGALAARLNAENNNSTVVDVLSEHAGVPLKVHCQVGTARPGGEGAAPKAGGGDKPRSSGRAEAPRRRERERPAVDDADRGAQPAEAGNGADRPGGNAGGGAAEDRPARPEAGGADSAPEARPGQANQAPADAGSGRGARRARAAMENARRRAAGGQQAASREASTAFSDGVPLPPEPDEGESSAPPEDSEPERPEPGRPEPPRPAGPPAGGEPEDGSDPFAAAVSLVERELGGKPI